jgi:hypothetical protein
MEHTQLTQNNLPAAAPLVAKTSDGLNPVGAKRTVTLETTKFSSFMALDRVDGLLFR